jgi:hypothetical protein
LSLQKLPKNKQVIEKIGTDPSSKNPGAAHGVCETQHHSRVRQLFAKSAIHDLPSSRRTSTVCLGTSIADAFRSGTPLLAAPTISEDLVSPPEIALPIEPSSIFEPLPLRPAFRASA